jgi:beta-lactamase regulating signal transducer with metallopeptidase domain
MELLIPFALKSLLVAGVTLGLLQLLRSRSASERSMVAHFGLLALLIVPLGSMFLPQLVMEVPVLSAPAAEPVIPAPVVAPQAAATGAVPSPTVAEPIALWPLFYGFPAALLLAVTFLAVLRLLVLRARASVLVEPSWLSALAHAQRRMNFKHGTALLTSTDLKSPISWGVLRPVILLNDEAIGAHHEAEAIIAHELAHVRGLDWAKLLLARLVTAIFWFNPLVWLLAREAHQLREETADDAVLEANVCNTDYAQLLVGVARHDCKGLLLSAHGVAPGKGSLSRRVRRVLDASLPRSQVARGFAAGIALGVIGTAAPLAALTFTPGASKKDADRPYCVSASQPSSSLPSVVADSVAQATALTGNMVSEQVTAALTGQPVTPATPLPAQDVQLASTALHPHPAPATPSAPRVAHDPAGDAIVARATGVTSDYLAAMRAAAPELNLDAGEVVPLRAVGASPDWLRGMVQAGYQNEDVGELVGARAVGITPAYVAGLAAVGIRNVPLDDLTSMRAVGVTPEYVRELRAHGINDLDVHKLVELRANRISAAALRGMRFEPPRPPSVDDAPDPDEPNVDPGEDDDPHPDPHD